MTGGKYGQVAALEAFLSPAKVLRGVGAALGDSVPLPGLCVSVPCTCKHKTNGSPRGSPGCHLATSLVHVLEEEYQPREERAGGGGEGERSDRRPSVGVPCTRARNSSWP